MNEMIKIVTMHAKKNGKKHRKFKWVSKNLLVIDTLKKGVSLWVRQQLMYILVKTCLCCHVGTYITVSQLTINCFGLFFNDMCQTMYPYMVHILINSLTLDNFYFFINYIIITMWTSLIKSLFFMNTFIYD
jgi:hypothetical protein